MPHPGRDIMIIDMDIDMVPEASLNSANGNVTSATEPVILLIRTHTVIDIDIDLIMNPVSADNDVLAQQSSHWPSHP